MKDIALDAWQEVKEEASDIMGLLKEEAEQGAVVMVKDGVKYLVKRAIHTVI